MVSLVGFGFLMVVGLASMAVIASIVRAVRLYVEPEEPRNFYGAAGFVILTGGVALLLFAPPATSALGLLAQFGGWFGIMLAAFYAALSIYHAKGMASDGGRQRPPEREDAGRDRPLGRR